MKRKFVCNKYKSYSIRNHYFQNGYFETEDPDVVKLIENADGYGVFIHSVETPEEIAAMKAAEEPPADPPADDPPPVAVQGGRGTRASRGTRRAHIVSPQEK